jgi:L-ascorbate metabolism protein UlaG (beta-lactamase superfamily)
MKIKKIGHCCLVLEIKGKRVMTDPGSYTIEQQEMEKNIDLVVITHEHPDHLHTESLKNILANNPNAVVVTNSAVGKILDEAEIKYQKLEGNQSGELSGVFLEAHDCRHEEIFEEIGQVQNTGYFISERLFYPGDAFYNPGKPVEILALPVAGPWAKVKDAMKYVLDVRPKICFPVHDGGVKSFGSAHRVPEAVLPKFGIVFKSLTDAKVEEF